MDAIREAPYNDDIDAETPRRVAGGVFACPEGVQRISHRMGDGSKKIFVLS